MLKALLLERYSMAKLAPYSPSRLDSMDFFRNFLHLNKCRFNIIDIGCGKLFFYKFLEEQNIKCNYLGIDINRLPKVSGSKNINVQLKKTDFLKYKTKNKFDLVTCLWVLEHIKEDYLAFKKIIDLTKDNGTIILAVPAIWSWPFEFGKHGYHYYSKDHLEKMIQESNLKVINYYQAGGFLGFLYMIFYNWPRYFILSVSLPIYLSAKFFNKKVSWNFFSVKLIRNTWYLYQKFTILVKFQNYIVGFIVKIDNHMKITPASYIYILKK